MEGRIRAPRVEKYVTEGGFRVLDALDEVAKKHNAKMGQVALAWLMARPSVTSPIASATNMDQLAELAATVELSIDADDIAKIDEASK
jgi:aryl-alcohol dehydrogenase-like predicted oxidoreductase